VAHENQQRHDVPSVLGSAPLLHEHGGELIREERVKETRI
jgi:hypothetical protein